jgi:DNA segregation ATPase FtsK/SpoIIIE, S-DNA-T family
VLVELTTSVVAGAVFGATKYFQSGGSKDHEKIVNIARNCGLVSKEGKEIRILRSNRGKAVSEYVYQMPQGLSEKQFHEKLDHFQDGLNIKRRVIDISLSDFKSLKPRRDILRQVERIFKKKRDQRKEVEIEFDGTIKFRIYNEPMTEDYCYEEAFKSHLNGWEIPVGLDRRGKLIKHDFDEIYNLIIAGAPGYGKSVTLKNIITTLIARKTKEAKFVLVDLKGGLAFNRFAKLEQVETVAKNPTEALTALQHAQERMTQTIDYLLAKGYEDVKEAGFKERLFIVIDEAADLSQEKEALEIVIDIARRGRGAGVRLVYATQYPTNETLPSQVRQNCDARLCFKLQTTTASLAVLDEKGAESLPFVRGRAIYRTDRKRIVQTPYIKNDFIDKTIKPNITFRPRTERTEVSESQINPTGTTRREYTLELETTRLS